MGELAEATDVNLGAEDKGDGAGDKGCSTERWRPWDL